MTPSLIAAAVVLLLCSGASAELVAQNAEGKNVTVRNMDLNFMDYNYDRVVHFQRYHFEDGCKLVAPAGSPVGALIDLKEAYESGCNTMVDFAVQLNDLPARPSFVLVLSQANGDPGSFEAYGIHPLSPNSPYADDMIYTFILREDWETLLDSPDDFTARVTDNPSSLTVTAAQPLFQAGYGILVALFGLIFIYFFGLLCWLIYHGAALINFRGYLLAAVLIYALTRVLLHSLSPFYTRPILPYTMTEFLWWFGFLVGYMALNVLFTVWARSSRLTTRTRKCGSCKCNMLTLSLTATAVGTTLMALILILRTVRHVLQSVIAASLIVYGLFAPVLLIQCIVFLIAGANLLHSLRGMESSQMGARTTVSRKLAMWLVTVCALFLAFFIVIICYTVFDAAIPWTMIAFEWTSELITGFIFIAFGLIVQNNDISGSRQYSSSMEDDSISKRGASTQLTSIVVNDKPKDVDVSTPTQRELLSLASSSPTTESA